MAGRTRVGSPLDTKHEGHRLSRAMVSLPATLAPDKHNDTTYCTAVILHCTTVNHSLRYLCVREGDRQTQKDADQQSGDREIETASCLPIIRLNLTDLQCSATGTQLCLQSATYVAVAR